MDWNLTTTVSIANANLFPPVFIGDPPGGWTVNGSSIDISNPAPTVHPNFVPMTQPNFGPVTPTPALPAAPVIIPAVTPERLAWLQEAARQSREAVERGNALAAAKEAEAKEAEEAKPPRLLTKSKRQIRIQ